MKSGKKGFTVIELIVVVVIVAALAAVTIFAFGTWRSRTAKTEVQNELLQAAAAIQNYKNFNTNIPNSQAVFNAQYTAGSAVTLTYIWRGATSTYCLNGTSTEDSSVKWSIDSAVNTSQVSQGHCS